MKNGSQGSAIACGDAGQARGEAVALDARHLEAQALRLRRGTSSTATAQPKRPSGAAATARPMADAAASSWSAMASTSR